MANIGKIIGVTAVVSLLVGGVYKGYSFYNKLKQASGNINFNVSFLRVQGLIGNGITKFLSPTIQVAFKLNIKNFSGFDIDVKKIYARVESNQANNDKWNVIATSSGFGHNSLYIEGYLNLKLKDGLEDNYDLYIDFKGLPTIKSLMNKTTRQRIVMTYEYKGQALDYTSDVDIATPINAYWQKIKNGIHSLKGVASFGNLQTAL